VKLGGRPGLRPLQMRPRAGGKARRERGPVDEALNGYATLDWEVEPATRISGPSNPCSRIGSAKRAARLARADHLGIGTLLFPNPPGGPLDESFNPLKLARRSRPAYRIGELADALTGEAAILETLVGALARLPVRFQRRTDPRDASGANAAWVVVTRERARVSVRQTRRADAADARQGIGTGEFPATRVPLFSQALTRARDACEPLAVLALPA
jgi:hypothetical protein